jgi:hypothetical protein
MLRQLDQGMEILWSEEPELLIEAAECDLLQTYLVVASFERVYTAR